MKKQMVAMAALLVVWLGSSAVWAADKAGPAEIGKTFVNPPDSARMWTWWFWLGDMVDKASITADLEALKAQGIAGVTVYSLSGPGVPGKGPDYMSAEWRELWKHTLKEADRLGLGVSTMLCSGWNSGGPWIKPEQACKQHVNSELVIDGPQHFKGQLPLPKGGQRFYRDVAIQAFPVPATSDTQKRLAPELMALKALRNTVSGFAPTKEINGAVLRSLPQEEPGTAIDPAVVIDLTARCDVNGVLEWDVPPGKWNILRTGYTLTGARTSWSSPTGAGLESDPLDAAAMEFQFSNTAARLAEDAGPHAGKVFRSVQIDSWEIRRPNWTAGLLESFKKLRGYDPRPYLPVLAGYVVGTSELSDRFLYDYRRTVGDLVAENYFGRLSALAESKGIFQQSEAGGVCSPCVDALDCLKNLGRCKIPMGEFWQDGTWVEANQNKNGKQTASAAHLYGRQIAAAEAFTSFVHWVDSPASLKPNADRAFCDGFNRFFIFSSATRTGDGFPGSEFCAGTHFNSKITWWNQSRSFCDYIARCSHMLQQGLFVGDVLFYNGDGCPNFVGPKHIDPALGAGYDYDACNTEIVLTRLAVRDGRIVLPDGMSYRLLVLPESATMPLEVIEKLKELVTAGMILVGPKPDKTPGLTGFPGCDQKVKAIAAELWGDCDGKNVKEHALGKGRVVWGKTIREVLAAEKVTPDFSYAGATADAFMDWIHRQADGVDIYFIANRRSRPEKATCTFRVRGRQPEFWDPVTGTQRESVSFRQGDGGTTLGMELPAFGSRFVVFRRPIGTDVAGTAESNEINLMPVLELAGPWKVQFDPQWFYPVEGLGGEAAKGLVTFEKLEDWSNRPEEAVKYYSGTATYRQSFDLQSPIRDSKSKIFLDLGTVKEMARIRLNGKDLGVVWCAPWRVEITGAVKEKGNELEIEVVNLWPNRLIGDGKIPQDQRRTRTNIQRYYQPPKKGEHKLLSSGLLGPVRVMAEQ